MKRKYPNHVIFRNSNFDFDVCNAISATDCTGLIPWAPNSEEQLDADVAAAKAAGKDVWRA